MAILYHCTACGRDSSSSNIYICGFCGANLAKEHPRAEIARLFNSLEGIAGSLHASNVTADFARLRELLTKEGFNLKR